MTPATAIQLVAAILHEPPVAEVYGQDGVAAIAADSGDIAHVSVADLFVVFELHDLVPETEATLAVSCLDLSLAGRIHLVPQQQVERVYAGGRLLTERGQQGYSIPSTSPSLMCTTASR